MAQTFVLLRRTTFASGLLSFSLLSEVLMAATPAPLSLSFKTKSYDLASADKAALDTLGAQAKADKTWLLTIKEPTAGLKTGSLPYIIGHDRSLRVYQALVRAGVDPAQIAAEQVPQGKGKANDSLVIVVAEQAAALATAPVTPSSAPQQAVGDDFTINFPSASAVAVNLDEQSFKSFLGAVGQPGRDAVVIEGHTDKVGNAAYNQALGELRALTVYEKLTRAGLPPYRVDTQSRGMAGATAAAEAGGGNQADRKVVVRWTKNEQIAAVAKTAEAPPSPAAVAPPAEPAKVIPPPPQPASPPPAAPVAEKTGNVLDVVPFAGVLQPGGQLRDNAKLGAIYGLGIGKAFWSDAQDEGRLTLFGSAKTKLQAKQPDRSGPLSINELNLRFDYVYGPVTALMRPFVGAGIGYYFWQGTIREPSSGLQNTGNKRDPGALLALGLEFPLTTTLFLAPEITGQKVYGNFQDVLYSGWLSLRWRI